MTNVIFLQGSYLHAVIDGSISKHLMTVAIGLNGLQRESEIWEGNVLGSRFLECKKEQLVCEYEKNTLYTRMELSVNIE